ncbi:MAG: helix-turn-helix transcriptional regulator [Hyphomonadaceae bacterium]|nr:MAG: XRE family transcriptional regulator [Caulobacteraceae bacterium]MBT9444435.1 helix-turn-helix transcriptional regulator [Hyphomonadaceae bacterium]TPW06387.1 MAG: XRE family transcriptional regulator [Alphaproteobacteria bacterium]
MSDERHANGVDKRIGQRVKQRRLELGMSQERLAELLGVTFQQIQKYEKGVNRVAASRLFELSSALGVALGYFFEGLTAGEPKAGVSEEGQDFVYDMLATPEGQQLLQIFGSIRSPRVRRRVVELVRALAEDEVAPATLPPAT